jgi:hypothetical protein
VKNYEVLENCHYNGVTWRKGETARLALDPDWPERFRLIGDKAPQQEVEPEKSQTKAKIKA